MTDIERTVTVSKPLSAVWAYLSDFTHTNDWDPGTVKTTLTSGDGGVGTVYANTSKFAGRETELEYTVIESIPEQKIQLRGVNKTVTATDTMTFTGDESQTTVTYHAHFDFNGVVALAAPLLALPFKKLGDEAEQGLKEFLGKL